MAKIPGEYPALLSNMRGGGYWRAVYKLEKLEHHVGRSRRLTNDLRMLRRLFFQA